ncbi:unnamed protein product [Lactuca virosa]|uniref:CCHC-type domain-containing protein n=1 Tax=Lactuca virosa TaxID=75947 RepID=A0AAU9NZS4_9ASTR|nr:unnamed protein product [Lactuca virosa]
MVCFHCNQTGHRKAEYPQLRGTAQGAPQGAPQGSASAGMRATKVRPVKAEAPKARGRAFKLTAEEVRAAHDVVAGTFLVSFVPSLVLFDSGVSRSFVSLAFNQHISIQREALSRPLRVSIADERAVYATDVIRGCVLEIFGVEFLIDLVPIAMGDVCVIVGMDWLS